MSAYPQQAMFNHGFFTEKADVRAHVSVVNREIYAFRYKPLLDLLNSNAEKYVKASAGQPGVIGKTAVGLKMPVKDIPDLRILKYHSWPRWAEFDAVYKDTGEKGRLAVHVVLDVMRCGRFPVWLQVAEDSRRDVQINGTDILVFQRQKVQVKCDWHSGPPPGTGNIFLQTQERNPLKIH